ncbi:hypothetical protein BU24DRAFT_51052 [Aaosphaeria arxii CBS 175.79]|uniref:Uncharacterized protein n=1 Tax=Aaosphaeria arxii CBS 175.79 TaxID=1450172 RepID=A0A6A5XD20_9PLEO|nr:uncharacterized protein BU24DRAFT_51052 [Aaosphaeria arxii CBS 175.79]KAF2011015.1 hypothetical protein BU24DRAFT_51052 [Aaosphaeria arxii CBS 175.79]
MNISLSQQYQTFNPHSLIFYQRAQRGISSTASPDLMAITDTTDHLVVHRLADPVPLTPPMFLASPKTNEILRKKGPLQTVGAGGFTLKRRLGDDSQSRIGWVSMRENSVSILFDFPLFAEKFGSCCCRASTVERYAADAVRIQSRQSSDMRGSASFVNVCSRCGRPDLDRGLGFELVIQEYILSCNQFSSLMASQIYS